MIMIRWSQKQCKVTLAAHYHAIAERNMYENYKDWKLFHCHVVVIVPILSILTQKSSIWIMHPSRSSSNSGHPYVAIFYNLISSCILAYMSIIDCDIEGGTSLRAWLKCLNSYRIHQSLNNHTASNEYLPHVWSMGHHEVPSWQLHGKGSLDLHQCTYSSNVTVMSTTRCWSYCMLVLPAEQSFSNRHLVPVVYILCGF